MSDEQPEEQPGPVVKVARDLREIADMSFSLDDQAEHKSADRLMPGGLAMVALGNVTNLEAWENRQQATERYGRAYTSAADEDDGWEPPLQTLLFWSEQWREHHGAEYDKRPTITSETSFLRWALDWAWGSLPEFDNFAADVRRARVRMENVLYAGSRVERSRIVCNQCDAKRRLIHVYGQAADASDDLWKCPGCKHRFDNDDLGKAHAAMLRSSGAERWVHQVDAIGTLKAQGRPERTVRAWLAEGEGSAYCDPVTHEVWVWWPDLWRKHLSAGTRKRGSA